MTAVPPLCGAPPVAGALLLLLAQPAAVSASTATPAATARVLRRIPQRLPRPTAGGRFASGAGVITVFLTVSFPQPASLRCGAWHPLGVCLAPALRRVKAPIRDYIQADGRDDQPAAPRGA